MSSSMFLRPQLIPSSRLITFSKNTESLIKNLGKGDNPDYSGCRECSICLGSVLVSLMGHWFMSFGIR